MITKTFQAKTLVLVFEKDVDAKGNPILVKKSFSSFSETATNEELYDLGTKLSALFNLPLVEIQVDEDSVLAM